MAKKATSKKTKAKQTAAKKTSGEQKAKGVARESTAESDAPKSKFDEAMANVVAGASRGMGRMSEEAPRIAAKTSEVAKEGYGKLKHGLSVAYDTGSKLTREAYREAKEQAERFKHTMEMRKLKTRRETLCADLGKVAYSEIAAGGMPAADAFSEDRFLQLIEQIRRVDNDIVEVAKELEKH